MAVIEFEDVCKSFGSTQALDQVSFRVEQGRIVGLLGPNGSGKTTALRLMLNLFEPASGRVRVLGGAPSHRINERIGYLPEERGLYRDMRADDLLVHYARLKGVRIGRAELEPWFERLHITQYRRERIRALSKGTAQKVQFLTAILHDPPLVILDEPFSGLDPVSRGHLRAAIEHLMSEGRTLIFSTHDMSAAESLCDSFVMLHRGRKVLDLSRQALREHTEERTIKLTTERPLDQGELPGVERRLVRGHDAELILAPAADPQAVLSAVSRTHAVTRFEVTHPSLEDLFLRLARE